MRPSLKTVRTIEQDWRNVQARVVIALVAVLSTIPAFAQELPVEDDLYHVELVVFARDVPLEHDYRHPGEPDTRLAVDVMAMSDAASDSNGRSVGVRFWPVALSHLAGVLNKLERFGQYRPIVDLAWEQTAVVFGQSRPVLIHGGEIVIPANSPVALVGEARADRAITEVSGIATLDRGRFLHLELDVAYHRPQQRRTTPAPLGRQDPFDADYPYQTHRITERRRLQLGEIQYFDHAQFGVLAVVRKVEPDATARTY